MCIVEMLTNISSILGTIIAICALCYTKHTYEENVKHDRIRATVSDFPQLRKNNQELVLNISDLDEREKELCLKCYLSQMEHFAVGINSGAYDLETVNRMSGGMLVNQYKRVTKNFINDRRNNKKHTEVGKEKVYCEYEKMIKNLYKLRSIEDEAEWKENFCEKDRGDKS